MCSPRIVPVLRIAAVAALLSPVIASPLIAQCSQADKAALEAFDKSWGDATVSGDRARMAPFLFARAIQEPAIGIWHGEDAKVPEA